MDEKNLRERQNACLINNYLEGPDTYHKALDPFPVWFQNGMKGL